MPSARKFAVLPDEGKDVAPKIARANGKAEEDEREEALASLEAAIQDSWEKLSPTDRQRIADRYLTE